VDQGHDEGFEERSISIITHEEGIGVAIEESFEEGIGVTIEEPFGEGIGVRIEYGIREGFE
jgi:hypothetical protein